MSKLVTKLERLNNIILKDPNLNLNYELVVRGTTYVLTQTIWPVNQEYCSNYKQCEKVINTEIKNLIHNYKVTCSEFERMAPTENIIFLTKLYKQLIGELNSLL